MHRSPEHNWEGYWLLKSGFEAYGGKSPDLYVYRTAAEAARREEKARRDNLIKAEAELEDEGAAKQAAGLLVQKWGAWLSVALQSANASVLRAALGGSELAGERAELLRADLSR